MYILIYVYIIYIHVCVYSFTRVLTNYDNIKISIFYLYLNNALILLILKGLNANDPGPPGFDPANLFNRQLVQRVTREQIINKSSKH